MKTLVVYDSVYGNTEIIARPIGDVLSGEMQVLRVGQVGVDELETANLLIIGSPTHGSLPAEAVRSLMGQIGPPARREARASTFDT
jgi:flavodoxin